MAAIAFVFAGQGAQYPSMGRSLYGLPSARAVFDHSERIRPGTLAQCFEGGDALNSTINVQPCVYTVALAAAQALTHAGVRPNALAGFSLGECTALAYAGVFAPGDGLRFVMERAELMDAASRENAGRMAAVLKLPDEDVAVLCREVGAHAVNFNAPGQVVASGTDEQLKALGPLAQARGGRMLPLKVSGAFHSPHMFEAGMAVERILGSYRLHAPALPVYSNDTALPYGSDIAVGLSRQVYHPVYWAATVRNMARDGITDFIEVGPGATLTNLIKRTLPDANAINVENADQVHAAVARYGEGTARADR